jgi:hypothetical protein
LLSFTYVLTIKVQDLRNTKALASRLPRTLITTETGFSFQKEFIFVGGIGIKRQRSAAAAILLIQLSQRLITTIQ